MLLILLQYAHTAKAGIGGASYFQGLCVAFETMSDSEEDAHGLVEGTSDEESGSAGEVAAVAAAGGGSDGHDGSGGDDELDDEVELRKIELEEFEAVEKKKGVVYLASIPPFMQVGKVRHLLSQFGEIGRIYLVPEDATIAKRRKKKGGNRKQNFVEGWVEFMDKRVAKAVARSLNATPIGGKKSEYYRDDMWNIKYLKHFKWSHLTEKIAYEKRVREQRLHAAIAQSKRETAFFLSTVDQKEKLEKMKAKRKARGGKDGEDNKDTIRRRFHQTATRTTGGDKLDSGLLRQVMGDGAVRRSKKLAATKRKTEALSGKSKKAKQES